MRQIVILLVLGVMLAATFQLSRMAARWHYVIPAEPGQLLYAAAFDPNTTDWEQDEGQLSSQVEAGVMRLRVARSGEGLYSAASPYFDNFDVTVESRMTNGVFDGNNNNGYGVVFRQLDRANYYVFIVSSDGSYRVKRVLDNESAFLSDWIFTDLINTETGAINRLRVIGQGERFAFHINDEVVPVCVPDNPDAQSTMFNGECLEGQLQDHLTDDAIRHGRLGVAVEVDRGQTEPVVVEFDNVVVYGPDDL